jgi:hypothetical protein
VISHRQPAVFGPVVQFGGTPPSLLPVPYWELVLRWALARHHAKTCVSSSYITSTMPGYAKICRGANDCTADQKCCLTHPGSVPFGGCRTKTQAGCTAL